MKDKIVGHLKNYQNKRKNSFSKKEKYHFVFRFISEIKWLLDQFQLMVIVIQNHNILNQMIFQKSLVLKYLLLL